MAHVIVVKWPGTNWMTVVASIEDLRRNYPPEKVRTAQARAYKVHVRQAWSVHPDGSSCSWTTEAVTLLLRNILDTVDDSASERIREIGETFGKSRPGNWKTILSAFPDMQSPTAFRRQVRTPNILPRDSRTPTTAS